MIIHTCLWVNFPGWKEIGKSDPMEKGDVVMFIPPATITQTGVKLPEVPDPNTYIYHNETEKGFVVQGFAGKPVTKIEDYYKFNDGYYAVLRKTGEPTNRKPKRPYEPSKWADPVPLP